MSESISCREALETLRRGETLPPALVRRLGEEQPADFFRIVIESLADSFDPVEAARYERLMSAWIAPLPRPPATLPDRVETVYVLSRVTLGADIKITSMMLDAFKKRFPDAAIVFVGNGKCAELFAADSAVSHLAAEYPRSGPVTARLDFARELRRRLEGPNRIVVDPDSRMTQLGLAPVCEPEHYFHFPSRTYPRSSVGKLPGNLTDLTQRWLFETFSQSGNAYIAPPPIAIDGDLPRAAVSLGVGGNESKRLSSEFETQIVRALAQHFATIWIDRGAGGEEARRVTAAVEASGFAERVRFWEGTFAGFASVISQCGLYTGYDSAGQHAAAAAGMPLISIFAGADSSRFRERWSPSGPGRIVVIDADAVSPALCFESFLSALSSVG